MFKLMTTGHFFTIFSALHSFGIGLLPFFLPVLLWQKSQQLSVVTEFIGWTGTGFIIALFLWHRLYLAGYRRLLAVLSFLLETVLIYLLLFHFSLDHLLLFGLLNGLFNCSYWMLQRVLFSSISSADNSGEKFGNFQIITGLSLKAGILVGGFFAMSQPGIIVALSLAITLWFCYFMLLKSGDKARLNWIGLKTDHENEIQGKISLRDRIIFLLDGPFLYLESYLWVLTIYQLSHQNTATFSLLIVGLSATLAILFFVIKRIIDNHSQTQMYLMATGLYCCTWLIRGGLATAQEPDWAWQITTLALITVAFFTSLFRLYFNKRFYDKAKHQQPYGYLLNKSLYSQVGICLFFFTITLHLTNSPGEGSAALIYWLMAPLAAIFFLYQPNPIHNTEFGDELIPKLPQDA